MAWWSCGFEAGVADRQHVIERYKAEVQDLTSWLNRVKLRPQLVVMVDKEQQVQPSVPDHESQMSPAGSQDRPAVTRLNQVLPGVPAGLGTFPGVHAGLGVVQEEEAGRSGSEGVGDTGTRMGVVEIYQCGLRYRDSVLFLQRWWHRRFRDARSSTT